MDALDLGLLLRLGTWSKQRYRPMGFKFCSQVAAPDGYGLYTSKVAGGKGGLRGVLCWLQLVVIL